MGWARTPKRAPACGGWGFCRGYSQSSPEGRPGPALQEQRGTSSRAGGPGAPSSALPRKALRGSLVSSRPPGPSGGLSPTSTLPEPTFVSAPSSAHWVPRGSPLHVHRPISFLPLPLLLFSLLPSSLSFQPLHFQRDESHLSSISPSSLGLQRKGRPSPPRRRHGAREMAGCIARRRAEWPREEGGLPGPQRGASSGRPLWRPRPPTRPHSQ